MQEHCLAAGLGTLAGIISFSSPPDYYLRQALGNMSSKISNIIAIELAILIGIMSWMTYFLYAHFSSAQRTMAEIRESTADRVATVTAGSPSAKRRPYTLYYRSGGERAPSRSAESAQEDGQDYQDVVTDSGSGFEDKSLVETSQSYAQLNQASAVEPAYVTPAQSVAYQQPVEPVLYQEPAAVAAYEEPVQTVVYQEPAQVYYQEPAYFVVYSNPYRFVNRFRSGQRRCGLVTATHRSQDRIGPHQQNRCGPVPQQQNVANVPRVEPRENVARIEPRRNRNRRSGRPTQGLRMEGIARQASGNQGLRLRN